MNEETFELGDGRTVHLQERGASAQVRAVVTVVDNWPNACDRGREEFLDAVSNDWSSAPFCQGAVKRVADRHSSCLEEFVRQLGGRIEAAEPESEPIVPGCVVSSAGYPTSRYLVIATSEKNHYHFRAPSSEPWWMGFQVHDGLARMLHLTWDHQSTYRNLGMAVTQVTVESLTPSPQGLLRRV